MKVKQTIATLSNSRLLPFCPVLAYQQKIALPGLLRLSERCNAPTTFSGPMKPEPASRLPVVPDKLHFTQELDEVQEEFATFSKISPQESNLLRKCVFR